MYQNLRHLIDPAAVEEKDSNSIHYLMLPQVRSAKFIYTASGQSFPCRQAFLRTIGETRYRCKERSWSWVDVSFFLTQYWVTSHERNALLISYLESIKEVNQYFSSL